MPKDLMLQFDIERKFQSWTFYDDSGDIPVQAKLVGVRRNAELDELVGEYDVITLTGKDGRRQRTRHLFVWQDIHAPAPVRIRIYPTCDA